MGKLNKEKKKENQENGEDDMWHGGGKWGEASPTFDQYVG